LNRFCLDITVSMVSQFLRRSDISASQKDIPKLYYSIGQVSRMAGVDQHVLRYWETEFKDLAPRKSRNGKRQYRESDVKTILRIKELLYRERYTIEGARRRLKEELKERVDSSDGTSSELYLKSYHLLAEIRKGLEEMKEMLK
jgi:DNA-binding transcriptional MerR regulator